VENGSGLLRALWRWSCFQLAERAGGAAEASGGGLHEAAVYAALSSHVARVLPVCGTWEDCCWAYLRCWLDAAVDAGLAAQQQDVETVAAATEGLLAADALAAAAGDGGSSSGGMQEGLAVMRGDWPISRVRDALPSTFEEALQAAISSRQAAAAGSGAAAAAVRYRRVQVSSLPAPVGGAVLSGVEHAPAYLLACEPASLHACMPLANPLHLGCCCAGCAGAGSGSGAGVPHAGAVDHAGKRCRCTGTADTAILLRPCCCCHRCLHCLQDGP
jgi:hypothetical protein